MTDSDALNDETLPIDATYPSSTVSPTPVSLPESHHGIIWEVLGPARLHKLAALISRMEAQDNPPYRTNTNEVAEMLAEDRTWRGLAGLTTRGIAKERMVALGQVVLREPGIIECLCQDGVGPSFRKIDLGGSLAVQQEATTGQILVRASDPGHMQITMQVKVGQEDPEEQSRPRGFHWVCTYYEPRADLSRIPNTPDLGSYLGIEPWGPEWEEPAHMVSNRLSELEWGRPPLTQEQWLSRRSAFVPEQSSVVVDRRGDHPRLLGFLLTSKYIQDWAVLGWHEGYIDQVGVLGEARSSHAVNTPVIASIQVMVEGEMDRIGTGLDSASHSGTLAVYDYLGSVTVAQTRLYALEVRVCPGRRGFAQITEAMIAGSGPMGRRRRHKSELYAA